MFGGRHATLAADGLQMVMLQRRADGQAGESLWHTSRASIEESFQRPREIRELNRLRSPKNPSLSSDGLTLVFNHNTTPIDQKIDYSKAEVVSCTRQRASDNWSPPLPFPLPQIEGFVTWGSITNDGLSFVACVEGKRNGDQGNMLVFKRGTTSSKFGSPTVISGEGLPTLIGRSPRFVPSTNELFFAGRSEDSWGLWMIRGFELPE